MTCDLSPINTYWCLTIYSLCPKN